MTDPSPDPTTDPSASGVRTLAPDEVPDFLRDELFSPDRELPIVAITSSRQTGAPWLDPERLASRLEGRAIVLALDTGETTWALSDTLPERMDVYGGATRIWWPGLTEQSDPVDHPLLFARTRRDGDRVFRRVLGLVHPAALDGLEVTPWERVAAAYEVGEIVPGRVVSVKDYGAVVELLPGATGLVHKSEMDWTFVEDPTEFVAHDDVVAVEILKLDPDAGRAELSMKRAIGHDVRESIALADGRPFLEAQALVDRAPGRPRPDDDFVGEDDADYEADELEERIDELEKRVAELEEERATLTRRLSDKTKELRSERDRHEHLRRETSQETDPASSPAAFLLGVRLAYARLYSESDRHEHPLRRMRVGPDLLDGLQELTDVPVDKVLEVCAQVAAGTAHDVPGRQVHELTAGSGGAPTRMRESDGARAWRCSLQDSTASARRLHWWQVPGDDGGTVEFANVDVHDSFDITE